MVMTNDTFLTSYGDLFRIISENSPVRFEKGIQYNNIKIIILLKVEDSTVIYVDLGV